MHRSIRSLVRALSLAAAFIALDASWSVATAQGKSHGAKERGASHASSGRKQKRVSTSEAVTVTREILVKHGYSVVRVERVGVTEVIYYRRGNNGRGRGLGPMERMVVRPSGDVVVFEAAPKGVLLDINIRLGL